MAVAKYVIFCAMVTRGNDAPLQFDTLKVTNISARNLLDADLGFLFGPSDPYACMTFPGNNLRATGILEDNASPEWLYGDNSDAPSFIAYNPDSDYLEITFYDNDLYPFLSESLGSSYVPYSGIKSAWLNRRNQSSLEMNMWGYLWLDGDVVSNEAGELSSVHLSVSIIPALAPALALQDR